MNPVRIIIAEDHVVVREGLCLLLGSQADIQVVAAGADGGEAVDLVRRYEPDVAILDISMPRVDGLQAASLIREASPRTQVLILTMHEEDIYFFRALEAGAAGYVVKKSASSELLAAVHAVARGEAYFPPRFARQLLDNYLEMAQDGGKAGPPGYHDLTEREKEIMLLLVHGRTNQEIAEKLVISASTVQTHRAHILQKLGLETTIDLVRYAIRYGIIEA